MFKILLVMQFALSIIMIISILLQDAASDSIMNVSGSSMSKDSISGKPTPSTPMRKVTIVCAALFLMNSLLLANFSSHNYDDHHSLAISSNQNSFPNKPIESKKK